MGSDVHQFVSTKRVSGVTSPKVVTDDFEVKSGNIFGMSLFGMDKTLRMIEPHATDNDVIVVNGSYDIPIKIGSDWFMANADVEIDTTTDMDTGAVSNGLDYYVYAVNNSGVLNFILSLNSTYPTGYAANTSEKIGGFHSLCADVGVIAGHALDGHLANSILPKSVWDLTHRPRAAPQGMVFSEQLNKWVDIYLTSGTGASTVSVFGGTISDTRNWMNFVDDFGAVNKRLLTDYEFQLIAANSNEETNIVGSADPVTTGGHVDTASRRMISDIGCEDCAGVMWQWLLDQSFRLDEMSHTHDIKITHKASATGSALFKDQAETKPNAILGSGADETITSEATDKLPSWGYYNLPESKGSLYRQGSYGDVKLLAGGNWSPGASAGSQARNASNYRWFTSTNIGGRALAELL
jgi:hypothetical protein